MSTSLPPNPGSSSIHMIICPPARALLNIRYLPALTRKETLIRKYTALRDIHFFLAVFHRWLKIPLAGIVFIQILLTLAAAFLTYKTAIRIDPRLGFLSALIVLYDPPVTIFSLIILTEAVFLFLMALFMYVFVRYLENSQKRTLVMCALVLVASVYVRPASYYLGIVPVFFVIWQATRRREWKKMVVHASLFAVIVSGITGLWHYRNYSLFGQNTFSSINNATVGMHGLYKSYSRRVEKGEIPGTENPVIYYSRLTTRSFLSLMTRPGSLKYFGPSKILKYSGKLFAYPWMIFWMIGFFVGLVRFKKDRRFLFLMVVILYFIGVTIVSITTQAYSRFRVPMVPFLAIVAAYGWVEVVVSQKRQN